MFVTRCRPGDRARQCVFLQSRCGRIGRLLFGPVFLEAQDCGRCKTRLEAREIAHELRAQDPATSALGPVRPCDCGYGSMVNPGLYCPSCCPQYSCGFIDAYCVDVCPGVSFNVHEVKLPLTRLILSGPPGRMALMLQHLLVGAGDVGGGFECSLYGLDLTASDPSGFLSRAALCNWFRGFSLRTRTAQQRLLQADGVVSLSRWYKPSLIRHKPDSVLRSSMDTSIVKGFQKFRKKQVVSHRRVGPGTFHVPRMFREVASGSCIASERVKRMFQRLSIMQKRRLLSQGEF
jgi:hypothetical protein